MQSADGTANDSYDLIIIGGGINGAAIARDAGLRGLRTLLLEAGDFGGGTSSWSTRLIHGGLRYLEHGEITLVRESLHERRRLLAQAPHLVRPLRLSIPIYRDAKRGRFVVSLGMIAYDLLSIGKSLQGHRMLDAREMLAAEPGLEAEGLSGGAQYFDAQVTYAERLVLENVLDAAAQGVEVRNYARVHAIEPVEARAHRVRFGADGRFSAVGRVVVNAAGPWVDRVLDTAGSGEPRLMGGTKGSHVVVGPFEGAPRDGLYVEARKDGRPIFIIPWNRQYLIGTTDIRVEGDPSDTRASDEEIDYLLGEANRVLPRAGLGFSDIHFTYSGVRPLPYEEAGPASAITRRHIIHEHSGKADGIISIIGGKLTTFRKLAEQTVDSACRKLGMSPGSCPTREAPFPGGRAFTESGPGPEPLASAVPAALPRLRSIYGSRVSDLGRLCRTERSLCRALDDEGQVLAAEVALAMRDEHAKTLVDLVYRRLMLGLEPVLDDRLIGRVLDLAAAEAGWDATDRRRELAALAAHNERLRRHG